MRCTIVPVPAATAPAATPSAAIAPNKDEEEPKFAFKPQEGGRKHKKRQDQRLIRKRKRGSSVRVIRNTVSTRNTAKA